MGMIGNAPAAGVIRSGDILDGTIDTADLKDAAITPVKLSVGAPTWDSSGNLTLQSTTTAISLTVKSTFGNAVIVADGPNNTKDIGFRVQVNGALKWLVGMPNNIADDNFSLFNANTSTDAFRVDASTNAFTAFGKFNVGSSGPTLGAINIAAGGAAGVGWSTGFNLGDSTNYFQIIQDGGISRFRNMGSGGFQFFNSAGNTSLFSIADSGALTNYQGNTLLHTGNLTYIPTTIVAPNDAVPSGANKFQPFLVSGAAPAPTGADGCVIAWTWTSGSYSSQIYIDIDPTNYYAVRTRASDGTWQAWRNL